MDSPARIGKYEIERLLGGGMSRVFQARDSVLGRKVAIKVLRGEPASDPQARARFLQEARSAASLSHKNILGVYDFGEEDGRPFMVMEWLEGQSLKRAIEDNSAGSLHARLQIALDVAHALEYVHSKGIIHRDVKPDNVFLDHSGCAKLMDFGISKSRDLSITQAGGTVGTPHYMSPEQLRGEPVNAAVDVWGFGVLLFELFTGTKAFPGDNIEQAFHNILYRPVDDLLLKMAGLPPSVIDMILACTSKDPAARLQDFSRIIPVLRAAVSDAPESPQPPSVSHAAAKSSAPVLLLTIPAGIGLLALLIFGSTLVRWSAIGILLIGAVWFAVRVFRRPPLFVGTSVPEPAPEASTRVFAPSPARPGPAAAAPIPFPPPLSQPAESTQVFRVTPGLRTPEPVPSVLDPDSPDVAVVVTNCSDLAFMGKRVNIRRFPFTIGRNGDLAISDPSLSRHHASIEFQQGVFFAHDMGSKNGTYVDGRRLAGQAPLFFGSTILIGSNLQLTFLSNELAELPDLTGKLIGGRYILADKLYSSAKSVLYRATDKKLPQTVVVKILAPGLARYPGYREQFEREARLACTLHHPHINRVLDYGETSLDIGEETNSLFLSMEHMEGGSLARRLADEEMFEVERVAQWLDQIAHGLDYMHGHGVIHGGIKPSSIVFDSMDNPYLTDFAIAVTAQDKANRTVIGSPAFLSPEQWADGELCPASDQYSLAVILYMILTGARPFEGQENPEVRKRNLARGPVPAHELASQSQRPEFPAAVSAVVQRAMAARHEERYSNATEFARAFRTALTEKQPAGRRRPYAFISYNRAASSPWALFFKNELERSYDCDVYVDAEQRDTVGQFPRKLERGIERCDVFVCLLAEGTLDSPWVKREIEVAHAARKPMVPIFQESFRFPADLNTLPPPQQELLLYDGIKLLDRQNIYVNAAVKSLSDAIRQLATS
jgi:serine/threonine protein kinase